MRFSHTFSIATLFGGKKEQSFSPTRKFWIFRLQSPRKLYRPHIINFLFQLKVYFHFHWMPEDIFVATRLFNKLQLPNVTKEFHKETDHLTDRDEYENNHYLDNPRYVNWTLPTQISPKLWQHKISEEEEHGTRFFANWVACLRNFFEFWLSASPKKLMLNSTRRWLKTASKSLACIVARNKRIEILFRST